MIKRIILKHKQQIIICCLCFLFSKNFGQNSFLHTWFNSSQNNLGQFYQLSDSSFILSGTQVSTSGIPNTLIIKCDKNGDSLYTFKYDNSSGGIISLLNDSEILATGLYINPWSISIVKINIINGDTLYVGIYPCSGACNSLNICLDKGYILQNFNAANYEFLKTDSNYNEEWHTSSLIANNAWQIKPDPLGGYVGVGTHGFVSNPYAVQRLDSIGNNIWSFGYGNVPFNSWNDYYIARDVVITQDSNYIVACWNNFMTFMKINRSTGDTIWTKSGETAFAINNAGNDTYITVTDSFGLINGNGNYIWQTQKVPYAFFVNYCAKTLDGGFAFSGHINHQTMVFVKLDSLGNMTNTSIFDIEKHKQVYFYPNPATDVLNFANTASSNFTFSVYDLFGNRVASVKNKTSIDVSALSAGVYVAEVKEGHKETREKFVKE